MSSINFKVSGLMKVNAHVKTIADKNKFRNALTLCCNLVLRDAVANCPIGDTGLLASSITKEVHDKYGIVGTNLKYGPCVEFGTGQYGDPAVAHTTKPYWRYQDPRTGEWRTTHGSRPQPFLVPALKKNKSPIIKILQKAAKE